MTVGYLGNSNPPQYQLGQFEKKYVHSIIHLNLGLNIQI